MRAKKKCLPNDQIVEVRNIFHITCILVRIPFIHLLGSLLVQWVLVRFSGREEPKHDLQVRIGEASLRLGGKVRLTGALLCLGG